MGYTILKFKNMSNGELSSEKLIFQAANNIFLLYGYHGTTLYQIAIQACVHKSAIHYYFRSKEKLYFHVVRNVLDQFLANGTNHELIKKQKWFLFTELYNNQKLFEKSLKELYLNDWNIKLMEIKKRMTVTL